MRFYLLGLSGALVTAAITCAPAQTRVDLRTQTRNVDFSSAASTKPSKTGTALPATCSVGETFFKTDVAPGQNQYACTAANVWTVQGSLAPDLSGNAGTVLSTDGAAMQWQPFGGDVSGSPAAVTVNKLVGRPVSATAPANGQMLGWSGTQWAPQTQAVSGVFGRTGTVTSQSGDYSAAQVTNAVDKTAANTYGAGARQTFVPSTSSSGLRLIPATLPASPQTGDLAVDANDGNHPKVFDGSSWVGMTTAPNYSTTFTAATTVTVPGTVHKLGSANLLVEVYDNRSPAWHVEPDYILIDPATNDVTVDFETPQSGRVVINAGGGGGGSGNPITAGAGIVTVQAGSQTQVAVDPTTVPTYLSATATLDFASIGFSGCSELTFALPGAVAGDAVAAGWPSALEAGLIGMMRVSAANTVAVRLCNLSGAALNPTSATFRATLVRSF